MASESKLSTWCLVRPRGGHPRLDAPSGFGPEGDAIGYLHDVTGGNVLAVAGLIVGDRENEENDTNLRQIANDIKGDYFAIPAGLQMVCKFGPELGHVTQENEDILFKDAHSHEMKRVLLGVTEAEVGDVGQVRRSGRRR